MSSSLALSPSAGHQNTTIEGSSDHQKAAIAGAAAPGVIIEATGSDDSGEARDSGSDEKKKKEKKATKKDKKEKKKDKDKKKDKKDKKTKDKSKKDEAKVKSSAAEASSDDGDDDALKAAEKKAAKEAKKAAKKAKELAKEKAKQEKEKDAEKETEKKEATDGTKDKVEDLTKEEETEDKSKDEDDDKELDKAKDAEKKEVVKEKETEKKVDNKEKDVKKDKKKDETKTKEKETSRGRDREARSKSRSKSRARSKSRPKKTKDEIPTSIAIEIKPSKSKHEKEHEDDVPTSISIKSGKSSSKSIKSSKSSKTSKTSKSSKTTKSDGRDKSRSKSRSKSRPRTSSERDVTETEQNLEQQQKAEGKKAWRSETHSPSKILDSARNLVAKAKMKSLRRISTSGMDLTVETDAAMRDSPKKKSKSSRRLKDGEDNKHESPKKKSSKKHHAKSRISIGRVEDLDMSDEKKAKIAKKLAAAKEKQKQAARGEKKRTPSHDTLDSFLATRQKNLQSTTSKDDRSRGGYSTASKLLRLRRRNVKLSSSGKLNKMMSDKKLPLAERADENSKDDCQLDDDGFGDSHSVYTSIPQATAGVTQSKDEVIAFWQNESDNSVVPWTKPKKKKKASAVKEESAAATAKSETAPLSPGGFEDKVEARQRRKQSLGRRPSLGQRRLSAGSMGRRASLSSGGRKSSISSIDSEDLGSINEKSVGSKEGLLAAPQKDTDPVAVPTSPRRKSLEKPPMGLAPVAEEGSASDLPSRPGLDRGGSRRGLERTSSWRPPALRREPSASFLFKQKDAGASSRRSRGNLFGDDIAEESAPEKKANVYTEDDVFSSYTWSLSSQDFYKIQRERLMLKESIRDNPLFRAYQKIEALAE